MEIQGLKFRNTCGACPEQYDVFLKDEEVGYVRLRCGVLRGDCGNLTVYRKSMTDGSDGMFISEESRMQHLNEIASAILKMLPKPSPEETSLALITQWLDTVTVEQFMEEFNSLPKGTGITMGEYLRTSLTSKE